MNVTFCIASVIFMTGIAAALFFLMKRRTADGAPMSDEMCREMIDRALKQLNCKAEWNVCEHGTDVSYTFQAGFFRICIPKKSRSISMVYMYMFDTSVSNIDCVRELCNMLNKQNDSKKFIYSVDGEKDFVNVHIVATLSSRHDSTKEMLQNEMNDIFRCRNVFYDTFSRMMMSSETSNIRDIEKSTAEWSRKNFLIHEHELMNQPADMRFRENSSDAMLLVSFVRKMLSNDSIEIASMQLCTDGGDSRESHCAEEIAAYHLSDAIIKDGKKVHNNATIVARYNDDTLPGFTRTMILHLAYEGGGECSIYYHVSLIQIPISAGGIYSISEVRNVLVAYDTDDSSKNYYEFMYLWKEAAEKRKKNIKLSDEEALASYTDREDEAYMVFEGRKLFLQHRLYEALPYLKKAYQCLCDRAQKLTANEIKAFYEVCFMIGSACCEMGDYERALPYLTNTIDAENFGIPIAEAIRYKKEYVNCLVNGGDYRAIGYVADFIAAIEGSKSYSSMPQHWTDFLCFLKRRYVHILIKKDMLGEAEAKLKDMLADPVNKDFAIDELSMLQKSKKKMQQ